MNLDEPCRVLQVYSPEKDAEFAGMSAAARLAWLDEIREFYVRAVLALERRARPRA